VTGGDVILKLEMVNDVPVHVGELRIHPVLGRLDSPENILANKLTAVVDRREPKDAQNKAAGLFPADVARVLLSVTNDDWQLVRWSDPPERARAAPSRGVVTGDAAPCARAVSRIS
jgi:hypothetical protein